MIAGETGRSFAKVHAAYRPRILRFLARLVGEEDAEDVAQEVFLRVGQGLTDFRGESSLTTWIYRIARNAALDRLRRRSARREEARDRREEARDPSPGAGGQAGDAAGDPVDEQPSGESRLIRGEMAECIRGRVELLPEPYRTALVLSESAGLSDAEIAAETGTSVGNAKIRLHRARAALREDLRRHCALYRDERNELACEPRSGVPSP